MAHAFQAQEGVVRWVQFPPQGGLNSATFADVQGPVADPGKSEALLVPAAARERGPCPETFRVIHCLANGTFTPSREGVGTPIEVALNVVVGLQDGVATPPASW